MTDSINAMLVSVRADTGAFARDVATMKAALEGPLAQGADKAGRMLQSSLDRFIQTGKFGLEDLRKVALSVMNDIARAAIEAGMGRLQSGVLGGNGSGSPGGLLAGLAAGGLSGSPGRATGGPVSPGRAYRVGEFGPEYFVPTSSGRVETAGRSGGSGPQSTRDIRITINVNGGSADTPDRMQATSRQIARAVRSAVLDAG